MDETPQWYVLRDLSRPNSKLSAFDKLTGKGIKCFTPLVRKVVTQGGKQEWKDVLHAWLAFRPTAHTTCSTRSCTRPQIAIPLRAWWLQGTHDRTRSRHGLFHPCRVLLHLFQILPSRRNHPGHAQPQNTHHRRSAPRLRRQPRHSTWHYRETPVSGTAYVVGSRRGGRTGIHTASVSEDFRNNVFTPHFIFVPLLLHIRTFRLVRPVRGENRNQLWHGTAYAERLGDWINRRWHVLSEWGAKDFTLTYWMIDYSNIFVSFKSERIVKDFLWQNSP